MQLKNKENRIGMCESVLTDKQFNLVLGGTLFWGFFLNFLFVVFFQDLFLEMNPIVLIVGYLIFSFIGIIIATSQSAVLSFIGYNMVSIPSGAVLSVALVDYGAGTITKALLIVCFVTVIMFIASTMFPDKFLSIGTPMFIALVSALVLEIITMLLGFNTTIFDWIFVLIFSGYIGYDFAKAQAYDKTINNAVDSALDLYLDLINLFLRILSLSKDD